eukprot:gene3956-4233_t
MSSLHLNCQHSVTVPTSSRQAEYVFDIKQSYSDNKLLVSASNHSITVYDYDLNLYHTHVAHSDTITNIAFSKSSSNVYYSSSADNSVMIWDSRNLNAPCKVKFDEEVAAMIVNDSDNLLVVNQGIDILFYDMRTLVSNKKPKPLGRYSDVHSDQVTQLAFSPTNPNILISGAEDGLIGVYALDAVEAEEAVASILNTDCPVSKIGFFGNNYEGVYSLSTVETSTLWHFPSAQRISSFQNIREQTNMDYLVDCIYENGNGQLYMMIGNHEGHTQLVIVNPNAIEEYSNIMNYNNTTMRCVCAPLRLNQGGLTTLYTGGEDGKINLLKQGDPATAVSNSNQRASVEIGAARVQVTKKNRYSPY